MACLLNCEQEKGCEHLFATAMHEASMMADFRQCTGSCTAAGKDVGPGGAVRKINVKAGNADN